jgi:hypothetical protein
MKLFLRILSIIIEIIVAVAIFIMVTQKTPLFDRAIPERSAWLSWTSSQTTETNTKIIQDNNITTWTSKTESTIISTNKNFSSETIIDKPVIQWLSCKSPRWSIVTDGNSIIAYRTQRASEDNTCYSEIRTCQNGKILGNFIYRTCDYIIDGQLIKSNGTREDIIIWASRSDQRLINLSKFYKKIQSTHKEYIQPQAYKNSTILTLSQAKPQKMDNSKITTNQDITDTLDQTTVQEDHSIDKNSCRTPRWKTITHGSFVYAYNFPINTIGQSCVAQKRSCNDGTLWWAYLYESCTFHTNSDIPQTTIHTEPSRSYRWTLSPYSPYVRPISDSTRDTLLLSHSNINWTTNNQNYIETKNCLTPWGDTVENGSHITAYRLSYQTDNSLCDRENRICRSWVLWWRYIYPSCTDQSNTTSSSSQETWVWRNIKSIGNDIHDVYVDSRAERNIESIGKDANNVRWWIKWWFK